MARHDERLYFFDARLHDPRFFKAKELVAVQYLDRPAEVPSKGWDVP